MVRAAQRYRVPLWVLTAVKLLETGAGSGLDSTSSAGAQGPFQFIPSTARTYRVNVRSFRSSSYGAAHYLRDLYDQFGSWNAALEAYNGGPGAVGKGYAYTQADAEDKLREFGTSKEELGGDTQFVGLNFGDLLKYVSPLYRLFQGEAPLPKFPGVPGTDFQLGDSVLGGGLGDLGKSLGDIAQFFVLLTTLEFWIRLVEVIAGAVLIYMGLKTLTGVSASDVPGATTARRAGEAAAFKRLPPKMRVS
jgi:hypothetical protein